MDYNLDVINYVSTNNNNNDLHVLCDFIIFALDMRLNHQIRSFLKQIIGDKIPESKIYLFGSRVDDKSNGGDIDLMILTKEPIDKKILRTIRVEFYKRFGWQKIDLVNFTEDDYSVFRQLIQSNCTVL